MRNVLYISVAILAFASCKKEDEVQPKPTVPQASKSYMPLEVGNYWVYETNNVDEFGVKTYMGQDSISISKDTTINGNKFYIMEGTFLGSSAAIRTILKDSAGYLVDPTGIFHLSSYNFQDTIYRNVELGGIKDTLYTVVGHMEKVPNPIQVPAGIFQDVIVNKHTYTFIHPSFSRGSRSTYTYYSNKIGKIKGVKWFAKQPSTIETELIRYHVK